MSYDQEYALGIRLAAVTSAISDSRTNRNIASALFQQARDIRRQLREA